MAKSAVSKDTKVARSETVGVRLDPKVRYLAEITAREQQRSLSSFIEWAVRQALTVEAARRFAQEDEATPGTEYVAKQPQRFEHEALWDVDEADRFFKLAWHRHDLLTIAEQRLWKLFNMGMGAGSHDLKEVLVKFQEFWNSPSINTSHLSEGGE